MTSVRKRKMAKSSVRKVTRKTKDKQRKINIACNTIIAKNWDHSLTLAQNYKKLGLRVKLGKPAGGTEADLQRQAKRTPISKRSAYDSDDSSDDGSTGAQSADEDEEYDPNEIPEGEARIRRAPDGSVIEVIYGRKKEEAAEIENTTNVVKELEDLSRCTKKKKQPMPGKSDDGWLSKLYARHGDDFQKMSRDLKLNIYQLSTGQLKRKITNWKRIRGMMIDT